MGIVNVTPDSFSDGGRFLDPAKAIDHALRLVDEGADIVDIGGESSRPGADPVPEEEERRRVLPIIEALSHRTDALLSIDTSKSTIARECLEAGAHLVNDITGLRDPQMAEIVARFDAAVVIMHMRGTPRTMQKNPVYGDLLNDIAGFLSRQAAVAEAAGVDGHSILLDPGIGFGKTLDQNLSILRNIGRFHIDGFPVLVGTSRKSFIGQILHDAPVDKRLEGSLASTVAAIVRGANVVRVHDVRAAARAVRIVDRICYG